MKGIMHTTAGADIRDPERNEKIEGMAKYGKILFMIWVADVIRSRKGFRTEFPYLAENGESWNPKAKYTTKPNPAYWRNTEEVIELCRQLGVRPVIHIFNEPTARHLGWAPVYSSWFPKLKFPDAYRRKPAGAWRNAVDDKIERFVVVLNKSVYKKGGEWVGGGMSCLLEGSGKGAQVFEAYVARTARSMGLKREVSIISSTIRHAKLIREIHIHSRGDADKLRFGDLGVTDGWYAERPSDVKELCRHARKDGWLYATWLNGLISGYWRLDKNGRRVGKRIKDYDKRPRPKMAQLVNGEVAGLVSALESA